MFKQENEPTKPSALNIFTGQYCRKLIQDQQTEWSDRYTKNLHKHKVATLLLSPPHGKVDVFVNYHSQLLRDFSSKLNHYDIVCASVLDNFSEEPLANIHMGHLAILKEMIRHETKMSLFSLNEVTRALYGQQSPLVKRFRHRFLPEDGVTYSYAQILGCHYDVTYEARADQATYLFDEYVRTLSDSPDTIDLLTISAELMTQLREDEINVAHNFLGRRPPFEKNQPNTYRH
jgi:hypothetical protein